MNLSAVILAGGESRRMGRAKAWLKVEGQPLIVHALAKVRDLGVREVFISARASGDYARLGCPVLPDREPACGPLGGIERGLEAATARGLLVLAVDLPHLTVSFLRQLVARCDASVGVVPRRARQLEPLAAIYPKRCHALAQGLIREGQYAACGFARACLRQGLVRAYGVAPAEAACLANWNRPSDLS